MSKRDRREQARAMKRRRGIFRLVGQVLEPHRITPVDPVFRAGLVLMSGLWAGNDVPMLAYLSGQPDSFVERVAARCRKARIWHGGTARVHWLNQDNGDFSFALDAMVAAGVIARGAADAKLKKAAAVRAKRRAEGRCANCGRARDTDKATCSACSASIRRSSERRKEMAAAPFALKPIETYYANRDVGANFVTKHAEEQ